MAGKARYYTSKTDYKTVTAYQAAYNRLDNKKFFCANPKCWVHMSLRNADHPELATFASFPKQASNHTGFACTKSGLSYNEHEYSKDLFVGDTFFKSLLQPVQHEDNSHPFNNPREHHIHNRRQTPVTNVRQLYPALNYYSKTESYGDIVIGDIYIDTENYALGMDISGNKILETSFYRYNAENKSVIMNFPIHLMEHTHVRIIFDDQDMFVGFIKRLRKPYHTKIIPVGGNWISLNAYEQNDEPLCIAECRISSQRQFAIFKPD